METDDKVILFDLDGTLIDTAPEMHLALNVLLEEEGLKSLSYEFIRPYVSHGVMGIFKNVFEDNPKVGGRRFKFFSLKHFHKSILSETELGLNNLNKKI